MSTGSSLLTKLEFQAGFTTTRLIKVEFLFGLQTLGPFSILILECVVLLYRDTWTLC